MFAHPVLQYKLVQKYVYRYDPEKDLLVPIEHGVLFVEEALRVIFKTPRLEDASTESVKKTGTTKGGDDGEDVRT